MSNVSLEFASGEDSLSPRSWLVEEGLSTLYEVRVVARSPKEDLDLGALVGKDATFRLRGGVLSGMEAERAWGGVCKSVALLEVEESETGLSTYEAIIVPRLWLLTQRRNDRLFQHLSIPQIVTAILGEWGIVPVLRIDEASYPVLELRTQYEETDHAFFCRLLEEAGITYVLEDGEAGSRLVLTDQPGARPARPLPIPFAETAVQAQRAGVEHVRRIRLQEEIRPGRVTLRDHDFRNPGYALFSQAAPAAAPEDAIEHYHYTPGAFLVEGHPLDPRTPVGDDLGTARSSQPAGTRLAQRSLEALRTGRRRVSFATNVASLSAGTVFSMVGHPRPDLGPPHTLLVTRMRFRGEVEREWEMTGEAVFSADPYRPARVTPKPRISGVHTAVVVGASGKMGAEVFPVGAAEEEIYTDEHGRIRAQLPWDREGRLDRNSSAWMRVSQAWAGPGYGLFTVPRVGHEVLVAFVDGDPDSPIVVGRVHTTKDPVPFGLPSNRTVSAWRSASSPRTGGFNEIRFDDAAGREMVFEQAERDRVRVVKRDELVGVGHDRIQAVQKSETIAVGNSRHRAVGIDDDLTVGNDRTETIGNCRTTLVGVDDTLLVGAKHSVTVARGLSAELKAEIERVMRGPMGPVLMGPISQVLGGLPASPYGGAPAGAAIEGFLASLGSLTGAHLRNVLGILDGYVATEGPDPTSVEIVDRRITLTTGEASLVLDGPNITLMASGNLMLHAKGSVGVLGDVEAALAGDRGVLVLSRAGDAVVQGAPNVHLNPLEQVPRPPAAAATGIAAGRDEAPEDAVLPPLPVPAFVGELAAALSGASADPEEMA